VCVGQYTPGADRWIHPYLSSRMSHGCGHQLVALSSRPLCVRRFPTLATHLGVLWVYDGAGSVATRAGAADGAAEAAAAGGEESVEEFMIREFYPWVKSPDDCQRCLEFLRSNEKLQFDLDKARVVMKQLRVRKHEVRGARALSWPCRSGPWIAVSCRRAAPLTRAALTRARRTPRRYAGQPLRALPRTTAIRAPQDVAGCACSLPWRPCAHTMRWKPPPTSSHEVRTRHQAGFESQCARRA
jgi:hypothetical protein